MIPNQNIIKTNMIKFKNTINELKDIIKDINKK